MGTIPTIESFEEFEARAVSFIIPPFQSRFGMMRLSDLNKPGPEMQWLVDDLLTMGDKSVIAGPSGSGKSFFAIEVGMSIARGVPVYGHPVKQGLVVYQAGEGALGIKNRLRAYIQHHGIKDPDAIPFVLLQSRVDLFAEDGDTAALIEEIEGIRQMYDVPLRMTVIDTLSKAQGIADENNGRDMGIVLNNIDLIREKTGAAVNLVHHLNADGTKLRGHTSVFANIDQVLAVTCDKETKVRTMRTAKVKDGTDDISIKFALAQVKLGEDSAGKEITSCVTLPEQQKQEFANEGGDKPFRPNSGEASFLRAMLEALRQNGEAPPKDLHRCPSTVLKVVDYNHVKYWFKRLNVREDVDTAKEQNRLSQALKRARENLVKFDVIGFDRPDSSTGGGFIWLSGKPVWGMKETYGDRKPKAKTPNNVVPIRGDLPIPGDDDDLPFLK